VKTPVFPFVRFPGVDTLLGPEMKSTGEVMGGAETFGSAFAKALHGRGPAPAAVGTAFISVNNRDKAASCRCARAGGARLPHVATRGTAAYLRAHGVDADIVFKINEGRPHVGDELLNSRIALVINTPLGRESFFDDRAVRSVAMMQGVPAITTLTGASRCRQRNRRATSRGAGVKSLQEYHAAKTAPSV
jgi:carbamoyl-phosphate synthase large subunit